jgi:hypothetical protein
MKSKLLLVVVLIFSIFGCDFVKYGFPSAQHKLSPESRLPKWVDISPEYTRAELTMEIWIYVHPIFILSKDKLIVRGPAPEHKVIQEIVATWRTHPLTKEQSWDVYPIYSILSVNGVEEVFEQREPKNILYVSDDPRVTAVLKKE